MSYLVGSALYLLIHFLTYSIWLRHRSAFSRERVIFLYHILSALLLGALVLVSWLVDPMNMTFSVAVAIVCAQGIYSLSFLELWALADAGFSLSILRTVKKANGDPLTLATLRHLGNTKRQARTRDLASLRLVRRTCRRLESTGFGRLAADAMRLVRWLSNLQDVG